jgi:hypothetical protein
MPECAQAVGVAIDAAEEAMAHLPQVPGMSLREAGKIRGAADHLFS